MRTSRAALVTRNANRPASTLTARRERAIMICDRSPVLVETRAAPAAVRRIVDLLILALATPIVLPLIALLALIVKLDSPGPAFVRIQRLGRDGRPFGLLKLRSMTRDAEQLKESARSTSTSSRGRTSRSPTTRA